MPRVALSFAVLLLGLAACTLVLPALAASPSSADTSADALDEITVTAHRQLDEHTLRTLVPGFITAHAEPIASTRQIARWRERICISTQGFQKQYSDLLSKRLQMLAARVAKKTHYLLGYEHDGSTVTTFSRAIQAWYVTGIRTVSGESRLIVDSPLNLPVMHKRYDSGSRLRSAVRSELVHVSRRSMPAVRCPASSIFTTVCPALDSRRGARGWACTRISDLPPPPGT